MVQEGVWKGFIKTPMYIRESIKSHAFTGQDALFKRPEKILSFHF
jgi:hypothetical protein